MAVERLNPVFTEHPVFEAPPREATLWRYMDFARYLALLERRALFFSSVRNFSDRFEGALTPTLLAELTAQPGDAADAHINWKLGSYLNCWNEDADESVALWNMYTSPAGGVAIKSSLASIQAALEPDTAAQVPPDELYAGRVRYVDYRTAAIPAENAFWPLVHKRTPYRFEHEVRLVAWPQRLIRAAQALQPQNWWAAVGDIAPLGYDVGIDPAVLIEAVVVAPEAPEWLRDLVVSVSRRYGLSVPVVQSELDAEPI